MDHLTRSGFDFVITSVFAMNETVRSRHQKYHSFDSLSVPRLAGPRIPRDVGKIRRLAMEQLIVVDSHEPSVVLRTEDM